MTNTRDPPADETVGAIPHPLEAMTDEELVTWMVREPDAFAVLYRRRLPAVYRYLMARLGDPQLAQDVTAQTFLAALEGLRGYRGEGAVLAWLLRIARNKAADTLRDRQMMLPLDAASAYASSAPSPERVVVARLQLAETLQALQTLAPERAEALALRIFGELSMAEVGAIMGKSEAAVKMLISRATHDLRKRLAVRVESEL